MPYLYAVTGAAFDLAVERTDGQAVLTVSGEIDMVTAPTLHQAAEALLLSQDVQDVVVDLSAVTFCDSSALRVLLQLRMTADRLGGAVHVRGASGTVARIFEVTGLDTVFKMPPTG
jgi:anti-anti-sigma factor